MRFSVCSFTLPVCVHAPTERQGQQALDVLTEAERALRMLSAQAMMPMPFPDGDAGGSPALDLYLGKTDSGWYRIGLETPTHLPIDRAAAFGVIDARLAEGCSRTTAIHRVVAAAMLAAIDGGEAGGAFASSASYLAMLSSGCTTQVMGALDLAQARPARPLIPPVDADDPSASPLLPWYLDASQGVGAPGALISALWYASRQSTPLASSRIRNAPDLFTVITRVAKARQRQLDDVLIDVAISRAFMGDRDDGQHAPETAFLGSQGRIKFDASWPYDSLPRRLAFAPLDPTGSVYVWVDLKSASQHPALSVHIEWEPPVTMHWAMVRVNDDGQEVSRIDLVHERGVFKTDSHVLELDGLAGLLIVGVSAGDIAHDHPYALDEAPYEPHGGTIYVYRDE